MNNKTYKEIYNTIYIKHMTGEKSCGVSVKSMAKAHSLVGQVWKVFNLPPISKNTSILDVGCGLGFISKALQEAGGNVFAIDISDIAIQLAKNSFPTVKFQCISFNKIISQKDKFDIIWALDFALISTHDVYFINNEFIQPCLGLLKEKGVLIVGWHTNFSGKTIGNWAHWSLRTIQQLSKISCLTGPRVVQIKSQFLSKSIIRICRIIKKSTPIFISFSKNDFF